MLKRCIKDGLAAPLPFICRECSVKLVSRTVLVPTLWRSYTSGTEKKDEPAIKKRTAKQTSATSSSTPSIANKSTASSSSKDSSPNPQNGDNSQTPESQPSNKKKKGGKPAKKKRKAKLGDKIFSRIVEEKPSVRNIMVQRIVRKKIRNIAAHDKLAKKKKAKKDAKTGAPGHGESLQSSASSELYVESSRHKGLKEVLLTKKPEAETIPGKHELLEMSTMGLTAVDEVDMPPVPTLAYGLDRVLFNQGVCHMQDPRSGVYNFDPYLEKILPFQEFDFDTLRDFTTAQRDPILRRYAKEHGKRYMGSTSSMSAILKVLHYQISQWRPINLGTLSKSFPLSSTNFTATTRAPEAVFLRYNDGIYAIDADKEFDSPNVLSLMGRYMEKLLTVDTETFERHRKGSPNPVTDEERSALESFHYSTAGDFIIRSQLDAYDQRLPGSGMFDLKTRAVLPIRMDTRNFQWGMKYELWSAQGEWYSFEREYYDMIRSTMLKYAFQVRMGRMDGIFVAYHNIARMFGFQYISIAEMDTVLHGQPDTCLGDQEFLASLDLMNKAFEKATERFPNQTIRLHFDCRDTVTPFTYIFAEPVSEDETERMQSRNKAKIHAWEEKVLNGQNVLSSGLTEFSAPLEQDSTPGFQLDENDPNTKIHNLFITNAVTSAGAIATEAYVPFGWTNNGIDIKDSPTPEHKYIVVRKGKDLHFIVGSESHVKKESEDLTIDANSLKLVEGLEAASDNFVLRRIGTPLDPTSSSISSKEELTTSTTNDTDSALPTQTHETLQPEPSIEPQAQIPTPTEAATSPPPDNHPDPATNLDTNLPIDTTFLSSLAPSPTTSSSPPPKNLLALILTTRSSVNGNFTTRPTNLKPTDHWTIDYTFSEITDSARAQKLYEACKARRKKVYEHGSDASEGEESAEAVGDDFFIRMLKEKARMSGEMRAKKDLQSETSSSSRGVRMAIER